MLYTTIDYPILHALCCCLSGPARKIFWLMTTHYPNLPIQTKEVRKILKMHIDVCYRALHELKDYNILHWDKTSGLLDFSYTGYENGILVDKKEKGVGPLVTDGRPPGSSIKREQEEESSEVL